MDSSTATLFLGKILDINLNSYGLPPTGGPTTSQDLSTMSLKQAQDALLKNTHISFNVEKLTKEELELFAVNPPLGPGYKKIDTLYVRCLSGETFSLNDIHTNARVLYLYKLIHQMTDIPIQSQRILFCGKQLDSFSTIAECNLKHQSTIHVTLKFRCGACVGQIIYSPPTHLLDEKYNIDFTQLDDVSRTFYRGGSIYVRPCGWMRFALKCNESYSKTSGSPAAVPDLKRPHQQMVNGSSLTMERAITTA